MSATRTLVEWVRRLLALPETELSRWQRAGRLGLELALHAARQLRTDRASAVAAALSFRTVLGLVPAFVLAIVGLRFLHGDEALSRPLRQLLEFFGLAGLDLAAAGDNGLSPVAEWVDAVVRRVMELNLAAIGVVGAGLLVHAALTILLEADHAFNRIYRSPHRRSLAARIASSWTVLTLGPLGLVAGFWVGERFRLLVAELGSARLLAAAGWLATFAISLAIVLLAYLVVPTARVRLRPALAGAVAAALLWELSKHGFRTYLGLATGHFAFYGSLGLVPVFLLWVYLSWLIVLFGLQVSHALQSLKPGRQALRRLAGGLGPPQDPLLRLAVLIELGRAFEHGRPIATPEIAAALQSVDEPVAAAVAHLLDRGFVHRVAEGGEPAEALALARSPETIRVADVLALTAAASTYSPGVREVAASASAAVGNRTLHDLLAADVAASRPGGVP